MADKDPQVLYDESFIYYIRVYKGSPRVQDLLSFEPKYFYTARNYPFTYDRLGWGRVEYYWYGYVNLIMLYDDPIIEIQSTREGLYNISKTVFNSKNLTSETNYYNLIKKEDVLGYIGLGFNGFLTYNYKLDRDHSKLLEFRYAYYSEFDLNKIRKQINFKYSDHRK